MRAINGEQEVLFPFFYQKMLLVLMSCLALLPLLMMSGCSKLVLTPVNQPASSSYNEGQIIWHDLITDDAEGAASFYSALLGWNYLKKGGYTVILNDTVPIGGIVELKDLRTQGKSAGWITYFSITDIDETATWVQRSGGTILQGPGTMSNRGRYATILDPLGAPLVILHSAHGDPPVKPPVHGDWLWNELWTSDLEASLEFYQNLAGYAAAQAGSPGTDDYWLLIDGQEQYQGGITIIPFDKLQSQWVPVVKVADTISVAEQVEALGGKVIINPDHPLSDGNVALIKDPTGAIFMVESWDDKQSGENQQQ